MRLTTAYFFNNVVANVIVYGKDFYGENYLVPNGGSLGYLTSGDEVEIENNIVVSHLGNAEPIVNEIKSLEKNIEQIKALINAAKNKTIEELS